MLLPPQTRNKPQARPALEPNRPLPLCRPLSPVALTTSLRIYAPKHTSRILFSPPFGVKETCGLPSAVIYSAGSDLAGAASTAPACVSVGTAFDVASHSNSLSLSAYKRRKLISCSLLPTWCSGGGRSGDCRRWSRGPRTGTDYRERASEIENK